MCRVRVKVCGLREPEHVLAAVEAGADFVGFVFAPSPRRVSVDAAVHLCDRLSGIEHCPAKVGVFADERVAVVNRVASRCRLDMVQLSGDEPPEYIESIGFPVIRTIPVFGATTVVELQERLASFQRCAPLYPVTFLLDTGGGRCRGGTGQVFDWSIARRLSAFPPVMVAGGLTPTNVGELIRRVHPFGVDVSSGVETEGRKDVSLIRAFIHAVRIAEQEMSDADNKAAR
jgi:phosphoribosylanthranilate isomerase